MLICTFSASTLKHLKKGILSKRKVYHIYYVRKGCTSSFTFKCAKLDNGYIMYSVKEEVFPLYCKGIQDCAHYSGGRFHIRLSLNENHRESSIKVCRSLNLAFAKFFCCKVM